MGMAKKDALTSKQRRFVAAYEGNGTAAAREAGYKGEAGTLAVTAYHLLRNPKVRDAILKREEGTLAKLVMTREERQELWSEIAADPSLEPRDRLKASELLGKSQADFTERLEVKGELTLVDLVRESMAKKPE